MITVKVPKITIEVPKGPTFWRAIGIQQVKTITKRTQAGRDYTGRRFTGYKRSTVISRADAGRKTHLVNLTFTGRMLRAMFRGVRPYKGGVKIIQTGAEGAKTFYNEKRGREFFNVGKKEKQTIVNIILKWMTKKNGLK